MRRLLILLAALLLLGLSAGCAAPRTEDPEPDPDPIPAPEPEPVSPVYTDWSQLTPYEPPEPLYTYFEPFSGDGSLQARSDYGPLLPYVGAYPNTQSYMGPLPLLGLVTAHGALVTDPVYADVHMVTDAEGRGVFLILCRGRLLGVTEDEWGAWPYGDFTYTVAAPDGSWVREFPGGGEYLLLSGRELALACEDGSVTVLLENGETEAYFPREALEPWLGEGFQWSWEGGPSLDLREGFLCVWRYDGNDPEGDGIACYLDPDTGQVTGSPPASPRPSPAPAPEDTEDPPAGYETQAVLTDPITGRIYRFAGHYGESGRDLLDGEGNLLMKDLQQPYLVLGLGELFSAWVWGDRVCRGEDGCFCYYDLDGQLIFRYPVETNED